MTMYLGLVTSFARSNEKLKRIFPCSKVSKNFKTITVAHAQGLSKQLYDHKDSPLCILRKLTSLPECFKNYRILHQ